MLCPVSFSTVSVCERPRVCCFRSIGVRFYLFFLLLVTRYLENLNGVFSVSALRFYTRKRATELWIL
uniref:Uncharacterized protein n=1 Tax=Salix viminalis TaxID=40686 RepID=A0A6N2LWS5_SALVM